MSHVDNELLKRAAAMIAEADALLIAAGAGMGVDSGLPDFRGPQGFWKAYPPYEKLGLNFVDLANPRHFARDPAFGWGFYGHRRNLYRRTTPHAGFGILRKWAERSNRGYFVFTSNVDAHFQKAGFDADRVMEVHGSIEHLQCVHNCGAGIYPAEAADIAIDETTMRAVEPLPRCPNCHDTARPNILMFGDWNWDEARTLTQRGRLEAWLAQLDARLTIVECGAGTGIPTVRNFCEQVAASSVGRLIRINRREPEVPRQQIGLEMGALEALTALDRLLG
jgi:NAD-dependent SIR2 family protein deacetylase